jgi:IS5 family transposase
MPLKSATFKMMKLGSANQPIRMKQCHTRRMERDGKMRVDTTVVETNVHYPTDSSLLGDGALVLTRTMKKVEKVTGGLKKADS